MNTLSGFKRKDVGISIGLGLISFVLTAGLTLRQWYPSEEKPIGTRVISAPPPRAAAVLAARPERTPVHRAATAAEFATETNVASAPASEATPAPEEEAARKRSMFVPVIVNVRRHPDGPGEIVVKSLSAESLEVSATVSDPGDQPVGQMAFTLAPHSERTLGAQNGWQLSSGSRISVQSEPYRERSVRVP